MSDLKLFFCPPHPFIISKLIPTHTESQTGKHTTQGSGDLNYGYVPDALRLLLPLIPPYFWLDIIKSAAAYNEVNLCFSFYLPSINSRILLKILLSMFVIWYILSTKLQNEFYERMSKLKQPCGERDWDRKSYIDWLLRKFKRKKSITQPRLLLACWEGSLGTCSR